MALRMESAGPTHSTERLRVGILLDSYIVPAWVANIVRRLQTSPFVEIAAVIQVPSTHHSHPFSRKHRLFTKYLEWDAQRTAPEHDPFALVDLAPDLAQIATAPSDLDLLLSLTSQPKPPEFHFSPRYGIWRFQHGNCPAENDAACFWDLYRNNHVVRTALLSFPAIAGSPHLLAEAFSATVPGWSHRLNAAVPYARTSALVLHSLRNISPNPEPQLSPEPPAPPCSPPSNAQMLKFLTRNAGRTIVRRARYSHHVPHWFIAFRTDRAKFLANTGRFDPAGFRPIEAPAGHFYADPFVIHWRGQDFLFFEDYPYAEGKGCISAMTIDANGKLGPPERVLERPYHLSYPFVFEQQNELFMIPETLAAERIELYRAIEGPSRWELVKILRDQVRAVDTTLWIENGVFYFFTNLAEGGATVNDDLFLFHADSLTGDWTPHPANPVCSDVRRSRSAGKLFRRGGKLFRPAQDCSVRYGYACQLNEIEVLSPLEYRERPAFRIEPDWLPGLVGTHTINSNENIEVIDAQIIVPKRRVGA